MGVVGGLAASGFVANLWAEDAPAKKSPVDEPLRLTTQARAAYAKVTDYQCVLIKRETIEGELGPNQVVEMKVRANPFSVYMKWQEPKALAAQELAYVAGKNDGKMRCRPAGLLGAIGFISLAPDDPRCKKTSKHSVTQAGIGHLIEACHNGWLKERELGVTQVKVGSFTYAKRKCTRVEMIHPTDGGGKLLHFKNVVYFDAETKLPIRVENYNWPKKPGEAPPLDEVFSYVNLRLNVGVDPATFEK
jgi:hypothetical protein